LWHAINPWHHRCNVDSCVEVEAPVFFAIDFYSFKSKGYIIQMQVVVDHWKRFQDVYVGIPSFVNDVWVLRMFSLYHKTIEQNLFVIELQHIRRKTGVFNYGFDYISTTFWSWKCDFQL
jgi:hypothetical protein